MPWKRWNVKGSKHAKVRMAELRERKLQLLKCDLIFKWELATGCTDRRGWWTAAQAAGLKPGCGAQACIDFLKSELTKIGNQP